MVKQQYPPEFLKLLESVTNKRARFVIDFILENGFVTTEDITNKGYEHAPRAARDVRELGIPLETFKVKSSSGKPIAAYRFGDLSQVRNNILQGRRVFPKSFKVQLAEERGACCEVDLTPLELRYLQVDHRIPYEVLGDSGELTSEHYMLLCSSCNRAKSWSCEKCENWNVKKEPATCKSCYWASPTAYTHIAMQEIRRLDVSFIEGDTKIYDDIKRIASNKGVSVQEYILDLLKGS
ncbi:HNH endonuclease [Peribacillus frigoritolerans]|uniref:HNH endonuclease signature motif containing protein n=1 Tax=Peribacillus frigoritolerans TaxID=450367 RepID=UPI00207AAB07|nr:HNH endonuclease signature motif containing protein [Peribacillus frigoritolerans]USK78938.1 HNH endonuclease [Peribacillus frigoritolerans]